MTQTIAKWGKAWALLAMGLLLVIGLAACSSTAEESAEVTDEASSSTEAEAESSTPESVTIQSLDASGETVDLEVPYDPERIAVLDMASLDILDNLGVGDRVVGSASISLDYLSEYGDNENVANLGTIKEADLEAVAAAEPDVIFIGGRLSGSYDTLSEIAPVVYLSTDTDKGVVQSVSDNATTIASMFGLESEVEALMADFEDRIAALQEAAEGHTALVTLYTSSSVSVLGNDGRCSIIGNEIGFENLADVDTTSTHGNEISFETILEEDPEYIFVLNRDAAIGSDGADQAQDIIENEITEQTQAYQNGNIIYLSNPTVWYTAEGGITALDYMLSDLEDVLL